MLRGEPAFTAVVRVEGPGRLGDFRERLRWLMVRDIDAEDYVERHEAGRLEYRFEPQKGIPFPAFAAASAEFPELRVQAEWRDALRGVRGRALIENGRLIEQESEPLGDESLACALDTSAEGELELALACARRGARWLGYGASAERHAYFALDETSGELRVAEDAGARWTACLRAGRARALDEPIEDALLAELERIAFRFANEWLWFDGEPPEQIALERARYAARGWPVRGANLKAEQRARLPAAGRIERLPPGAAQVPELLRALWGARR
ncbi:MAG TPA: hypothetical protein VEH51_09760 [Burkholderiales bacterium]|nr:hypothetical protein [Burkholderiales bacterium]